MLQRVKFFETEAGTHGSVSRWIGDNNQTARYEFMRKLLLSTVSVAALMTLAACGDETASNEENPTAIEETAGVDTTVPSADEQASIPSGGAADETATPETRMQADADTDADTGSAMVGGEATVEADAFADIEDAKQAVADARDAIQSESESAAVQALIQVERAIDNLEDPAEAQQAVDETRNNVIEGDFEAALASLSDVEMAIDNAQANAGVPALDETTASTTE
jgi:hypothetical protein